MNKLNMDLMKAKYQFMQQNPQYKHFATDLSGNIIGFDQQGNPKVVHEATPEEKSIRLDKATTDNSYKQAMGNLANARATGVGSLDDLKGPLIQAQTEKAKAQATRLLNPVPKTSTKADPMVITPGQREALIKKQMDPSIVKFGSPDDPDTKADYDRASKIVDGMGYKVLTAPGQGNGLAAPAGQAPATPNFGVFGAGVPGAVPSNGSVSGDDEEEEPDVDSDDENIMGM
jgi:hypothetical protein